MAHISELHGRSQTRALKSILTHLSRNQCDFFGTIFYFGRKLRPALRDLISDKRIGWVAAWFLALIGEPDDLRVIIERRSPLRVNSFRDHWARDVASFLLTPNSEEEWRFLHACALNTHPEWSCESAARRTLSLIASPRSIEILNEVQRKAGASQGTGYARFDPDTLVATTPAALIAKILQTFKFGVRSEAGAPDFNEEGDKAMVAIQFRVGRDLLLYTAVLYKIQDTWRLRGLRVSGQALLVRTPD